MKINKLFHWLYAILMLLPFAFFVPSVLYYAFNDNATMQSVEVPKTETIAVDFNQYYLGVDREYTYYTQDFEDGYCTVNINNITSGIISRNSSLAFNLVGNHKYLFKYSASQTITNITFQVFINTPGYPYLNYERQEYIYTISSDRNNVGIYYQIPGNFEVTNLIVCIQLYDLTQMFGFGNEPTIQEFNSYFPLDYYAYNTGELMQITYDTGVTEQLVQNTDIINYAWESIWDLPLFNWTKVTFVSIPFAYITGLFGLAASNSLNYLFGYFATISICWLVFDIIMYVPMLVHRWIDKARLE